MATIWKNWATFYSNILPHKLQTTSIEPFKGNYISDLVLKKLLTLDVYVEIKVKKDDENKTLDFIIQVGGVLKCDTLGNFRNLRPYAV